MKTEKRETRQIVADLCKLLGGDMLTGADQFQIRGHIIDLSATHDDYIGIETAKEIERQAILYGEFVAKKKIKDFLGD